MPCSFGVLVALPAAYFAYRELLAFGVYIIRKNPEINVSFSKKSNILSVGMCPGLMKRLTLGRLFLMFGPDTSHTAIKAIGLNFRRGDAPFAKKSALKKGKMVELCQKVENSIAN